MSRRPPPRPASPWNKAVPELTIAALALVACAVGAFVLGGAPGTVLVVVIFSTVALVVASRLLPGEANPPVRPDLPDERRRASGWFHNYWRLQSRVKEGTTYLTSYQSGLGPQLEHLLAARLSERHGVNLYSDPDAARRILCARSRDNDLWAWVDPARPSPGQTQAPGIPARTLARLVQRLEQL